MTGKIKHPRMIVSPRIPGSAGTQHAASDCRFSQKAALQSESRSPAGTGSSGSARCAVPAVRRGVLSQTDLPLPSGGMSA